MDRNDMEKLMDKYKKEMLEFRRRNGEMLYETANEQEKGMLDAAAGNESYERDRSDPLGIQSEPEEESTPYQPAVRAQSNSIQMQEQSTETDSRGIVDAASALRRRCENVNAQSSEEQRRKCTEINDFLSRNPQTGILRINTFASEQAFGVGSTRVMVFLPLESGNVTVFDGITDVSGLTDGVRLPAPDKELSQSPSGNKTLPFAEYTVYVEHPSYVRAIFSSVPVFSGIESIQPVQMLAKVDGVSDPEPIAVDEAPTNTL